jgi:hypothetical protein
LPTSAHRPDYIFSDENDKDHLFINNYSGRPEGDGTALYFATYSAFMPNDLATDLGIDVSHPEKWTYKSVFCQPGTNEGLELDVPNPSIQTTEDIMGCSGINVVTVTQDINPVDKVDYYKDHVMVEYEF